ncbi:unnamed protein product [Rotaria sp. Silwood2]|nr:unnamed protein product [Rotaria sp. Silwood2]CAF4268783.1 unnamed protein product [Rotaria sp. Silwood2]
MIEFDTVHYLAMVYFYLPSDFVFIIIARKWLCRAVRYYELEPGITSICDLVCDVGRIEIFRAYIMRNKSHNEKVNKTLDYLYPNLDVHKSQYLNRLLDHCVRRLSPIEAWFFDPLLTILQKYDNDERNENKPEVVQNGVDIKCRKQRRRKQKRRKQKLRKGNR